jgi:hypothetical protein
MPVYNGAKWLGEALGSLLAQTYDDFEIVISDNASTDETEKVVAEFAAHDDRIRYIRQPENIGVFRNYDVVFKGCRTPYFKWASGNDICMPTMLERCISALERRSEAVLAYPTTVLFDAESGSRDIYEEGFDLDIDDAVQRYRTVFAKMRLNNIMNGVIRSEPLRRTSLNKVILGSDVNMIAELVLLGPAVHVDEPLFFRRMSPEASVSARDVSQVKEFYAHEPDQTQSLQETKSLTTALVWAWKTPRAFSVKFGAVGHALRRIVWRRHQILRELRLRLRRS